jgi:hypothetical protein
MLFRSLRQSALTALSVILFAQHISAQTSSTTPTSDATTTRASTTPTLTPTAASSTVPDVYLNVPTLSVGRIELDVEDLRADINLNAQVANLVTLNAGVAVSIQEVNLTISDVDANLELIVRLGHLVDIVNRVFESLDLNPLLIGAINNVTSLLEPIVGAVDGLLGSITQGGTTLSFLIDNLGNIVQEVGGVSSIVGNYLQNMTDTGVSKTLSGGLIEKTFSYTPLDALVDIVFNAAGQVVQAQVQKSGSGGTSSTTSGVSSSTSKPASSTTTTPVATTTS